MIVIGGPRESNFSADEIMILVHYVKHGGSLLIIHDEGGDYGANCNLSELTQYFGFHYESDILFDSVNFQNVQNRIIIKDLEPHPLTEHVDAIVQSSTCSIRINNLADSQEEIDIIPLAKTSLNCYKTKWDGKEWIQELDSPNSIVALSVKFFEGKIVALSTVSMFSSLSSSYGFYARNNQDFIANLFNWLLDSQDSAQKFQDFKLISIPIKINLFLWMEKLVKTKQWKEIGSIVNFALKNLKKNYNQVMADMIISKEASESTAFENSSDLIIDNQESITASMNPEEIGEISRQSEKDLQEIMKNLNEITNGEISANFDFDSLKMDQDLTQKEFTTNKERIAEGCLEITNLDTTDDQILKNQIIDQNIVVSCEDESKSANNQDKKDQSEIVKPVEGKKKKEISPKTLKAMMDAKLDDAFSSLDSFEDFQKKIEEFKKLTEKDDPIS